jgi:hypothetical protein
MKQTGDIPVQGRVYGITKGDGDTGVAQRKNMVGRMLQLPLGR